MESNKRKVCVKKLFVQGNREKLLYSQEIKLNAFYKSEVRLMKKYFLYQMRSYFKY